MGGYLFDFREDVAESFPAWWAWHFKSKSVDQSDINTVASTIPNRLKVFERLYKSGKFNETIEQNVIKQRAFVQAYRSGNLETPHVIGPVIEGRFPFW